VSDTIRVVLPNGVPIDGVPRGTSPEEIKAIAIARGLATEADFESGAPPAEQPGPTMAELEQGAMLQEQNDELSGVQRFNVAMGRGLDNDRRGAQALMTGQDPAPRDPSVEAAYGDLSQRYPVSTTVGEVTGEALPFVVPGVGVDALLTRAGARLSTRLAAQGGVGASEGATVAAGREQNVPAGAAIGFGLTVGADLILPYLYRAGRSLVRRVMNREPLEPVIDATGNLSDEVTRAAEEAGMTPDDIVDQVLDLAERSPEAAAASQAAQSGTAPGADDITGALSATRKGPEELARAVDPDPEIMAAAERLGVDDLIPASAVSQNRAFQEAEQGLKSSGANELGVAESRFLEKFKAEVDQTITMMGGTLDRGALNADVAEDFAAARSRLEELEGIAFDRVRNEIPSTARAPIGNTEELIDGLINSYGGREPAKDLLTSAEKRVLRIIDSIEEEGAPTYAALDRIRKDIGQALRKKTGPFKDDATDRLEKLYSALRQDQKATAEYFGVGDVFEEANALTVRRKGLEERMADLFGKNLDQDLLSKVDAGVKDLGDRQSMAKLKKVMDALPAGRRQEAAATLLNRMFTANARSESVLSQGFVGYYDQLNRSPKVKDFFFSYLPEEARQRMDDIHSVAKGFYGALQYENKSRTANSVIRKFEDGGWLRKILGLSQRVPGGRMVLGDVVQMAADASSRTGAAEKLLQSPKFREALRAAATKNAKSADDALRGTRAFRDWLELQPPGVATTIASVGAVPYLLDLMGEDDDAQAE